MRWNAVPPPAKPRFGDVRYVKLFPILPYKTCGKWYWLEAVVIRQVWSLGRDEYQSFVQLWKDEAVIE